MIVNHRYKFIFIRTRKVASTSIEIALSKYCDSNDIVTTMGAHDGGKTRRELGYQMPCNYTDFEPHEPAETACKKLKYLSVWESYFKFSIIRDPFEYLISDYFWKNPNMEKSFDYFVDKNIRDKKNNWFIHSINDNPAMDYYVRYENLTDDLNTVSERLELPGMLGDEVSKIHEKSQYRRNRSIEISGETHKKITQYYRSEIDLVDKLKSR